MAIGKKGIFFTLISIFILAAMLLLVSSQSYFTLKDEVPITQTGVAIGNNFIKNLEQIYVARPLSAISYRALDTLNKYMNGSCVNDRREDFLNNRAEFDSKFAELVLNGTIDGEPCTDLSGQNPMKDYNLTSRLNEIERLSFEIYNINATFNKDYNLLKSSIIAYQSPETKFYRVAVNVTLNYNVTMPIAIWNRNAIIHIMTEIYFLDDPLYLVNSSQSGIYYSNKFLPTNIAGWNVSTFRMFINSTYYRASGRAPDFLSRYYSDFTPSACCGMESAVNPAIIRNNTWSENSHHNMRSYIDWCYFGGNTTCVTGSRLWNITGVSNYTVGGYYNGFKIDTDSAALYNLTDWINTTYCDPGEPKCS